MTMKKSLAFIKFLDGNEYGIIANLDAHNYSILLNELKLFDDVDINNLISLFESRKIKYEVIKGCSYLIDSKYEKIDRFQINMYEA